MPKKRNYEVFVTFTDHKGRVHEPPDYPETYPPWFPLPNEYRRNVKLESCPDAKCRRAGKCVSLLYKQFCQKTHMTADDFRWALCNRIDELMRGKIGDEWDRIMAEPKEEEWPVPGPEWKKWLNEAYDRLEKQELQTRQQKWVDEQKEKERKMLEERAARQAGKRRPKRSGNHAPASPGITTR